MRRIAFTLATLSLGACQSVRTSVSPAWEHDGKSQSEIDAESQRALQPIPDEQYEAQLHDFCEDNIYAQYLEELYMEDARGEIQAIRNYRQRRAAERNLRYHVRHHLNQRIEGPHPPYFGALPVVETPRVQIWLDYFQGRGRTAFLTWLIRSRSVEPIVLPLLQQEGLPPEVFFMAMIESGFSNTAYSRASATGTWQFMTSTALHYGLTINHWVDERRDPVKSTVAAARFLKDLYRDFDDWYLAIAAYNAGPGKIRSAIRRSKSRDFWEIAKTPYIRPETKHYVPKMLAALIIASNPEKYGFYVIPDPRDMTPQSTVLVKRPSRLREIASRLGLDYQLLRRWNPELLREITPPSHRVAGDGYPLRLPEWYAERFASIENDLEKLEIRDVKMYQIRSGDTLSAIARKHKISLQRILQMNPKLNPKRLRPGRKIAIPIPAVISTDSKETA
ncbi:MAG: transglycosylase SLT domain-containing protein [Oligoflexus sp.]